YLALTNGVFGARPLSLLTFCVETFGVSREALVDPHIRLILHGDAVAPPFVRAFVDDDEIPLESASCRGSIASQIPVLVMIAIRDGALMFHAEVRCLDELVSVFVQPLRTSREFEGQENRVHLLEWRSECVELIL